jgi:hypothetical protein
MCTNEQYSKNQQWHPPQQESEIVIVAGKSRRNEHGCSTLLNVNSDHDDTTAASSLIFQSVSLDFGSRHSPLQRTRS